METRLIMEIGTRVYLGKMWPGECGAGQHRAETLYAELKAGEPPLKINSFKQFPPEAWPTHCEVCGEPVPEEANSYASQTRFYNTESGRPEPGDMFWAPWYHGEDKKFHCQWDNCDDPRGHLIVVLPNGHQWDTDGRASNCTMKEDRLHRCWCRHGEPPNIHVDKNGHTCQAGAGSIMAGNYHGFLHNGELVEC